MFITIDGLDGVGKSTQSLLLFQYLRSIYGDNKVILTREPGGTKINESIRNIILQNSDLDQIAELLFFIAMRREHFIKIIKPALIEQKIVICDRFIDSTVAYQGYGYGLDLKLINELNDLVISIQPDITFIIDSCVSNALLRAQANKFEVMGNDFYNKVRSGFQIIANQNPKRCYLISCDSTKQTSNNSINDVHKQIVDIVKDKIID